MRNKLKKIRHELYYLKKEDFRQIPIFIISIIPTLVVLLIVKILKKRIWIISEDKYEARDNGYCFYKYISELNVKGLDVYYAISYKSKDYDYVKNIGKTVNYGSVKHWILYFCSEYVISSQKDCRPGTAIGYVLERMHLVGQKNIFLQHGITINNGEWLYYKNTLMRLFICGAQPEYDYISQNFGYPDKNLKYLGFSRFDEYHDLDIKKNQLLLMPSWREWIGSKNEFSGVYDSSDNFMDTEYFQKYQSLINNKELIDFLEKNDLILFFYPHRNMQKFIKDFTTSSKKIIVADSSYDLRKLLKESVVMITDYSSVALDFAYMKKNVIYYQFDEKRFREAQYKEGYYSYRESGLGKVYTEEQDVINELIKLYRNNWKVSDEFEQAHRKFFTVYDSNNSKRIFDTLYGGLD